MPEIAIGQIWLERGEALGVPYSRQVKVQGVDGDLIGVAPLNDDGTVKETRTKRRVQRKWFGAFPGFSYVSG